MNVVRLLNEHALTSPELTGSWEHRLGKIERGEDSRKDFMSDIAGFAQETVKELDETLKDVRIPRAKLGPCPVCGHEIVENRKGYSCWAREDPGCGFVIWKSKAGKQLPIAVARELIKTGYTARAVTGFRGRSGRTFRAHLAMSQTEDGKWRVEFDEDWAKEGAKPPEAEAEATAETVEAGTGYRPAQRRARVSSGRRSLPVRQDVGPVRRMPITLITGPANAGKAQVVLDAVRRQIAHGEEPLLVVPTRADAEHYLRELAGGGAAMGASRAALRRADRGGGPPRRRARGGARRARARTADRDASAAPHRHASLAGARSRRGGAPG